MWPSIQIIREAFQVGRPSMSLMTAFVYLYNNKNPSLWMTLYFGFIFQLSANAGNDYMDWERDRAHEDHGSRNIDESRGKARSKNFVWWYYVFGTAVSFLVGWFADQFFGLQYLVIVELAGQWAYNGILLGYPMNELSIVKTFGFPLDIVVSAWTYTPFPYLVAQKRWTPDLTIFAWGATMIWGQLKDYQFEKDTTVRTTATFLGEFKCAVFICVAAVLMMYQDWRFTPYGLYTIYRCYMYLYVGDHKAKWKMSAMMGLNLVGIVWCDTNIPFTIKAASFGAHILAYLANKKARTIEQKYYALKGIINHKRPYCPSLWDEEDTDALLWKVGGLTGLSGSAIMGLFKIDVARLSLLHNVYFRTQDTLSNVDPSGLKKLPKRLQGLLDGTIEAGVMKREEIEEISSVKWDNSKRPRDPMYVDITKSVHRFDKIFMKLSEAHKKITIAYVNDLTSGLMELDQLKDEPVSNAIMRKHAETALDTGFFALCKAVAPELYDSIRPSSRNAADPKARDGYIAYSDFVWHVWKLGAMDGCLEPEVMKRVRIQWLIKALTFFGDSVDFLQHALLVDNWMVRALVSQFTNVSMGIAEKYVREYQGREPFQESDSIALFRHVVEGLNVDAYSKGIEESMDKSEMLLEQLMVIQRESPRVSVK